MFQRVLLDFVLKTFGLGAENEARTRDPDLGKVVLYQLSYFRVLGLQKYATFLKLQILFKLFCNFFTNKSQIPSKTSHHSQNRGANPSLAT